MNTSTSSTKGKALVTGASTGIGAVYADRLARQGYDLILVARSADKLAQVASRISAETGRNVETITADLADATSSKVVEARLRDDSSITMLVNNAGLGAASKLLQSDIDDMEKLISINVVALTRLTYAAVPAMVKRGAGTIINISSIAAISPEVLNGVYAGTKAYVVALTQSLQHELGGSGLRFQAVLPGATATPFWDTAGVPIAHLPSEIVMSAEDMVDASLRGLELGELLTIPAVPDAADVSRLEDARRNLFPNLSRTTPASRYTA